MNQNLRTILDELYALEPALRDQEEELIPLLTKLLEHKPDAEPDSAFVQRLRMMLKDRAETRAPRVSTSSYFSFLTMNPFSTAIAGAVMGVVVTAPIVYGVITNSSGAPAGTTPLFSSYSVEETSPQAFGNLGSPSVTANYGRGQGGGGGSPAMDAAMPDAKMIAPDSMIYPVEITEYNFTVDGEMPGLTQEQISVLKRKKGAASPSISAILGSFDTGLIDLASFQNTKIDSINFYEDKSYGYMFYVNFREGSLSINANWEKWPQPVNYEPLSINDIPADADLLAVANAFVRDHDINVSGYGAPEVDNNWRGQYEIMTDKSMAYVPDQARVVYPLLIEGQPVYDEGGGKMGISVGINVRENRVSDVWGIMDQSFLKSDYAAVTDAAAVTTFLDAMGDMQRQWMPEGTTVKTVDITLGAPTMGYTRMYVYDEASRTGDELIVPALIFPVTSQPEGSYFGRTSIAVPLARELLEKMNQPVVMPIDVRPMMDTPVAE